MVPQVVREPDEMQRCAMRLRRDGKRIGVVPTMGALHDGHRALIVEARQRCDVLAVTVFVNPTQFDPGEDLAAYPRTFDADLEVCGAEGVDFVFCPTDEMMYGKGYATWVEVKGLTERLCGRSRPVHFRGVTTVVTKLFNVTQPDVAVFGWKDAQQLLVIRRMARDLNFPVEIVGVDTVREDDGLALSSRNKYLLADERAEAPRLHMALQEACRRSKDDGMTDAAELQRGIVEQTEREAPSARIDYVEIVSMDSIEPIERVEAGNTLIALAAFFGSTRLIDNMRL